MSADYVPPLPSMKGGKGQERAQYMKRLGELRTARSSWEQHWRQLAQYVSPRRSRFFQSEAVVAGQKKEQYIINGTATWALRTLAAGMVAGIVSPARQWFRLAPMDANLAEVDSVKQWCHEAAEALLDAFSHSNFYTSIHTLLLDLPLFGTALVVMEADEKSTLRCYCIPIGEYFLAQSDRGVVDTMYRLTSFTVSQLVQRFGEETCSRRVRQAFKNKQLDMLIQVVHVVEPRADYDPSKKTPDQKPWRSCWFEESGDVSTGFLLESGYDENPLLAPRWSVCGNNVYGDSPGMEVLGDCKSLQLYEKHLARAAELMVDPPTIGPTTMKNAGVSTLPGVRNWGDVNGQGQKIEPILTVVPGAVQVIGGQIQELVSRIKTGLYADLWMSILNRQDDPRKTATEIQAIEREKMLQLGPVEERFEDELLNVAVERGLNILARAGKLPPLPPELKGQQLRAQYSSIMQEAQKSLSATGISQLTEFMENVLPSKPEVVDNFDADEAFRQMAKAFDVAPSVVVAADKVQQIRVQRQKQAAQQQQQEQALAATQAAKNLGTARVGGTALDQVVGPVAAAQAGGGAS